MGPSNSNVLGAEDCLVTQIETDNVQLHCKFP